MGTRGAVGFRLDNKFYVTYNHSDSYPAGGLGDEVVKFCMFVEGLQAWEKLAENVRKLILIDEYSGKPTQEDVDRYQRYCDLSVSNQTSYDWYCLLRHAQNGVMLWDVLSGKMGHINDGFDFMKDSLFCEYAYIINLDDMTLDFYKGFQKYPTQTNLPFEMVPLGSGYYPVALVEQFHFENLPTQWEKDEEDDPLPLDNSCD